MIQTRPASMLSISHILRLPVSSLGALCVGLFMFASPMVAQAQDSEPDRREKLTHYSLYYENFKNESYEDARSDLLWVLEHAPGTPDGDDDNYEHAVELYEGLAEQSNDEETRKAHLDTAATYLATAPQKMKEQDIQFSQYKWEVRRGRFLERHQSSLSDVDGLQNPVHHYRKAFELAPKEVNAYYVQRVLQSHLQQNQLNKALKYAKTLEKKRGDDEEVMEMVSSVREQIFNKNPQARADYLQKQLKQHPDSTQLLTQLFSIYTDQGNVSKASDLAKKLMEMDPPAETILKIARQRLNNGRPKAALEAYDRAVEQGAELKAEDHFNRGSAHQEAGNLAKARTEYRNAIQMKEDFARAYIAIGDLYAKAVNQCSGSEMGRKDRAVYWTAVDKYQQAKRVNSSVSSTANSKIQRYRQVFPAKEDIFYRGDWEDGGSFTIDYGCYSWIGETTTVRPSPSSG